MSMVVAERGGVQALAPTHPTPNATGIGNGKAA